MKKFLVVMSYLALASSLWAADFSLNPARDFGAIRRINPTDYDGKSVVREDGTGLSSDTAAAFRAALEVFSKAEAEPAGAVATHAALVSAHGAIGAVVGTSNTQSLTNKTITDASNHISGAVIDTGVVADANIASTIARDSEYIAADSAVLSACNASDALNLRLDGSRAISQNVDNAWSTSLLFQKARAGSSVKSGDELGQVQARLFDGSSYGAACKMIFFAGPGTISTTSRPGSIAFLTVSDGTTSNIERMRITPSGNVLINTTTDDGTNKLQVNGSAAISGDLTVTGASTNFRNAIKAVDGAGSGLDADTVPNATPASASAAGTAGMIRYDANYIYICVAANTWKRAAISTW